MKKWILLVIVVMGYGAVEAQEAQKFRFDIGIGYASSANEGGDGFLISFEPKYTINGRMNVGLRAQGAAVVKGVNIGDTVVEDPEIGALVSYLGTFDYYFHKSGSSFAPFVGGGIGYYGTANFDGSQDNSGDINDDLDVDGKFGGMIRTGFDWYKFRLALEYNLVPKSDLNDFSGTVIGETENTYVGVSLGFYFGGGKWKQS